MRDGVPMQPPSAPLTKILHNTTLGIQQMMKMVRTKGSEEGEEQ